MINFYFYFSSLDFIYKNYRLCSNNKQEPRMRLNNYYMQQPDNIAPPANFYKPCKKIVVQTSGLFKMAKFDEDHILFASSEDDCIVLINNQLNHKTMTTYQFPRRPSALDLVELGGKKFVVVGCQNGKITVKAVDQQINNNENYQIKLSRALQFLPDEPSQIYINDIAHSPTNPNIIANCYNNGSIGVWGLLSQKRLHTFKQVHEKYTYKIRFQTPETIVSCGHDCTVVRTDLERHKYVSLFSHPAAVWCAYPIDHNQIASVGLFGRVIVWDVRSNRIAQACSNFGHQSSYITTKPGNNQHLFYGDMPLLMKLDRRVLRAQPITAYRMNQSAQALLFSGDYLFACGRGNDLCRFQATSQQLFMHDLQIDEININLKVSSSKMSEHDDDDDGDSDYEDIDSDEDQDQDVVEESKMVKKQTPLVNSQNQKNQPTIESIANLSINLIQGYLRNQLKFKYHPESESEQSSSEQGQEKVQKMEDEEVEISVKQLKQKKREEDQKLLLQNQLRKQQFSQKKQEKAMEPEKKIQPDEKDMQGQ